jgi:hypothetical protein
MAGRRSAVLSAVIPRKYRGVGFDRPPVTEIAERAPGQVRAIRAYVRDLDANLDAGRGCGSSAGPGRERPRWR